MRKAFYFLLGFFLLSLLSCSNRQAPNTLTLTMSLSEEEWGVFRREIFPLFEKRHNIKINTYQIEASLLPLKLETLQKAKKSKIDVFAQDNMALASLVNKGLVLDLSRYQKKIPQEVLPNLVDVGKFGKKLFFMPFRPNVQITYYNEEAFKKYGLPLPETWEDLLFVAKVFHKKEGVGRVLLKGFGGNPTTTQVYEFIVQAGGKPYAFNDAGCIKAFEFLKKLGPHLSPEFKRAKWDTTNDILAHREAFWANNWPFGAVVLVRDYGLNFIKTYSGFRGPAGKKHVIGGDVFGIPRNSKNKKLALSFIFFMQSKEVQEILTTELGWPSIREDAYGQVPAWQKPYFDSVREALREGVFRKNITWWPAYNKFITLAFRDIVIKQMDVKSTLDRYKNEMEIQKERLSDQYQ